MNSTGSAAIGSEPLRKLSGIEVCRGIAATAVVLYHVARHLDKATGAPLRQGALQFGHAGVDFFFVISGFIILFSHYNDVGKPLRFTRYIIRRFVRLMPTYWIALALVVALDYAGRHTPSLASLTWSASLLPSNRNMVLDVAWTLRFEILFYALFSVLIINRLAGLAVLTAWLSAALLVHITSLELNWMPEQFYATYILEFFLGMSVAYLLRNYTVPLSWLAFAVGLVLFGTAAALEDVHILNGYTSAARLVYGIPAALIVLGIAEAERQNLLRVPLALQRLGGASYSIYLFQFVFIATAWKVLVATRLNQHMPLAADFAVLALAAIAGGVCVSIWIEHPLIRLMRSWRFASGLRSFVGTFIQSLRPGEGIPNDSREGTTSLAREMPPIVGVNGTISHSGPRI